MAGPLAGVDLTDLDHFAAGFPHDLFALHRREAPVYWHQPTDNTPDGEGFWSVATHAETLAVLRDPVTYSSVTGGTRPFGGTLLQDLSIAGQVLNMMDDPRHSAIRRLVSSGLTPRMVGRIEDDLRARTRTLLDSVVPCQPFDFLVDVAAELPMQMICILLGVPDSERHWLFQAIEPQFDFGGARKASVGQMSAEEAGSRMHAYGQELIASKRAQPTDDMLSVVANAVFDDAPALSDLELYLFFSLLFSAGAETTRNAVAGGLLALIEHPDQMPALRDDLSGLPVAIEEMVRWTSPSPSKRRTATRDVTLGGRAIEAGQKVLVWELGQPRRCGVCRRRLVRHRSQAQPALGFRPGRALLPWRQPRAPGVAGAVRGDAWAVLLGACGQAGGVDPQQPAHRHPSPGGRTRLRPDAFAAVMATGIVSVAAGDHGLDAISTVLAAVAAVALPVLVVATARAWKRDGWELRDLDTAMALLTYVAACAVLASRFGEHRVVVLVLGGMALQGWLSLAPFVARGMWRRRWTGLRDRAHGGWELASVATSGLAIVFVEARILFWALICWAIALCLYCVVTGLVVWRAVHDPAMRRWNGDGPPDVWILMGGLAIATLAGDHIHHALYPGPFADVVRVVTIVTWVLASLWIVPLAVSGWRRARDWPAVFPLGMYSSATFAMAVETGWSWLRVPSLAFFWIAFALWLAVPVRFVASKER